VHCVQRGDHPRHILAHKPAAPLAGGLVPSPQAGSMLGGPVFCVKKMRFELRLGVEFECHFECWGK